MKRFFKTGAACALALALMSTSAFAAVSETGHSVGFDKDGKLDVTIAGDTAGEQVALLVLKGDNKKEADLATVLKTDIAYIDQKAGAASLAFNDINVGEATAVTVFAGSTNTKKAILLGSASLKAPELNASAKSFNVAAGVETSVDLALTDEYTKPVTEATVTYKLKNTGDTPKDALADGVVTNVSETSWKFNFTTAGTYDVKFTKNGVSADVVVCVYEKSTPAEITGGKKFVVKTKPNAADPSKTDVAAVVKVNLGTSSSTGKGKLIWSIELSDGDRCYTTAKEVDSDMLSGEVAMACGFTNDTKLDVTAVNVIYKNADGKVFFTDDADAKNEDPNSVK